MSHAPTDAVSYPMSRGRCPFDPPPELSRRLAEDPVSRVRIWDGGESWLVTRYDDVRALLADPRVSADSSREGFPAHTPGHRLRPARARSFLDLDDPEHAAQRRLLAADFKVTRMEGLRPTIQKVVDGLVDEMLAAPRPTDLVAAFALPVPSLVICALLGVPYADRAFIHRISTTMTSSEVPAEESLAAVDELLDYLTRLVEVKLATPEDDLLSRLAAEQVTTGAMTVQDVTSMARLLLVAGHETTANMITLGIAALLEHPDQLEAVRDGDALVANAVEELLRYLSVVHSGRRRTARADLEVGGQRIREGDGLIAADDVANRDPSRFPEPDRLDVFRTVRHHLAFGYGPHQCLGQALARVELQVAYSTILRRIPTLRLAVPLAELRFKHDMVVYGVHELPVTW